MKRFRISGNHYDLLQAHLYPGDGKEAVALALCGRSQFKDFYTLSVMDLLLVPYDACLERTPTRVTWPTELINSFVAKAKKNNLSIVKIHCHPGGGEFFSQFDDISDNELFELVFSWTQNEGFHGSCIMLPDGKIFGRFFDSSLNSHIIDKVSVAGPDIIEWQYHSSKQLDEEIHKRNLQAFGKGTIEKLSSMKIGVVGCSGTGSPVIEQLKRYGIGELVVVDPDYVDILNLNRIIGSTKEDALLKKPKTSIVVREIEKVGFNTNVIAFNSDIVNYEVVKQLSTCDLLFSCVDGVEGRHILNLISTYYLIPLIDMGVKLDAKGDGKIDGIYGSVQFIAPGGSSLLSRGQYTVEQLTAASIKRSNKEAFLRNQYLAEVNEDTPAVISINMLVASLAVNEMLARIHKYRYFDSRDVDAIRVHFHLGRTLLEQYPEPCKYFCKYLGLADRENLLDLIELGNAQ